jgi:DNA-binding transcriptional LysR family regulator
LTRFTLRQLAYFIAAGESGSIVLASKGANISESAISTAITHLEREFGVQLFVRHHAQGLSLTPAGRGLLREAKLLVNQAHGLYAAASDLSQQMRGQISVGCLVTLAPVVLPDLAHSFMDAHPGCTVLPREDHQEGLLERLRRAEIDIAVTYDLQIAEDIDFTALLSLPPHALFGASHPMAHRSSVKLSELAKEPLILLDLPISRDYFFGLFVQERLEPRVVWRSPNQDVVRSMVANGYGYTLANVRPRADVALDGRRVHRVALAGNPAPIALGTARLRQLRKTRLVEAFEAHCRDRLAARGSHGMQPPPMPRRPARRAAATTTVARNGD